MSISLPSEMADGVRQRVASGTYATSEVMNPQRAALRGLAGHKPKWPTAIRFGRAVAPLYLVSCELHSGIN
ncbi:ribbon-helix-helix domain-containing protein [Burkholderia sp. F1]|uniref:ribbon-helix-helix domain-containing protein n=1 Tax=Burkholderia sp. F1 TaxID=3366817 RepID=UPI003D714C66